jgi:putative ABC transport system permease protein
MLMGDAAKYLGIVFGLTIASFLITQQGSIFCGLMSRTFGFLTDTGHADLWVMDPKVQFVDDIKPLQDTQLLRVRGVEGVAWAVPLYKGLLKARLSNGNFQTCNVVGLDDATLIGGPPFMIEGRLEDLRRAEAVIVDDVGANGKLARELPDGTRVPLKVGDTLELNDRRAVVVGICRVTRTFQSQPVVYTTYSRATQFAPRERKLMSFILVKARVGVNPEALSQRIVDQTSHHDGDGSRPTLAAVPHDAFKWQTVVYFMKNTGIPINFGIAVLLGFFVGLAIAAQTFYQFTLENIRHFGALKAMGAGNGLLLRMIVLQGAIVGGIGYGLGVGLAAFMGYRVGGATELAFFMPWQLLLIAGVATILIVCLSSSISLLKVMRLEPGIVFK